MPQKRSGYARQAPLPRPRQLHRGYEGYLSVPNNLAGIIVGIFGLDDRTITTRNTVPPGELPFGFGNNWLTVPQVCQLYGWPNGPNAVIQGQTIGILTTSTGFDQNDLSLYYQNVNKSLYQAGYYAQGGTGTAIKPPVGAVVGNLPVPVPTIGLGANGGTSDGEVNMDICLASSVAPGAEIAVYFMDGGYTGWLAALQAAIFPAATPQIPNPPSPSVISTSYYVLNADDPTYISYEGWTDTEINTLSSYFADAKTMGITVCVASGDTGTSSKLQDGYAHVQYPASDPGVLCCGGTVIGNLVPVPGKQNTWTFDEYIWNDYFEEITGPPGVGSARTSLNRIGNLALSTLR
jgi:kumamolisin